MSFSSKLRRLVAKTARRNAAREERRRRAARAACGRRLFEILESRQMLDAAGAFESLPDAITIAPGDSYHYAFEGVDAQVLDGGDLDGLTATVPNGTQVAFTVEKTDATSGAVSTLGEVVIQLFEAEGEAPLSSARFKELIDDGYYDGLSIHRIISGFMFQGGSSDGAGYAGEGTTIADEHSDVLTHSRRGTVAFANKGADTSDAQFYVTFDATSWLDGSYNVFGFVVDGYEVLDALEEAEVVANASGEVSKPVDSYTISNARFLETSEVDEGVLRLVADDDASGTTTVTLVATDADGVTQMKEIAVTVAGETDLASLVPAEVELTAGDDAKTITLPATADGQTLVYTVYVPEDLEGVEVVHTAGSNVYTIRAEENAAQTVALTITVATADGSRTANATQRLYIAPAVPTFVLSEGVKTAELDDGTLLVAANGSTGAPIELTVESYSEDATLVVKIDGTKRAYTTVSKTVAEEDGLTTTQIRLTLDEALADGEHTIVVSQYLPINNVVDHDPLYSEESTLAVTVDAAELAFADDVPETVSVKANETSGAIPLRTNKLDEDGENRSDVAFAFAPETTAPDWISLSEDGVLCWSAEIVSAGEYPVSIVATDALGNQATTTITFDVAAGPTFTVSGETTVDEGGEFEITITVDDGQEFVAPYTFELTQTPTLEDDADKVFVLTPADDGKSAVFAWQTTENLGPGEYRFVVKIADAEGATSYANLDLTVDEVNVAPRIVYDGETTIETDDATPISIQLTATDGDIPAQTLVWSLDENAPSWMTIDQTGLLSAPEPVYGTYSVAVTVSDGVATSEPLTLTFNIAETDKAPVFETTTLPDATTGETYSTTVVAVDPNSAQNPIKYALVDKDDWPEELALDETTGELTWTIDEDLIDDETVSYTTIQIAVKATEQILDEDGETYSDGLSTEKTFTLKILNANYNEEEAETPVWGEIAAQSATAGETFETTVAATVSEEASVEYALTGEDVPTGMTIDAETGKISWAIPEDYISDNSIASKTITVSVKATTVVEASEEGSAYGGSATTSFELTIANPNYETPVWTEIAAQNATAGETFETTVVATVSEEASVEYALTGDDVPTGMTIDAETGKISWAIPEDYISDVSVESKTITVSVKATTVVSRDEEGTAKYGGSATTSFELTIANPNYEDPSTEYATWGDWFVAVAANAQAQADGHAVNLAAYLAAYSDAADARDASLATAQVYYAKGKTTITEFLASRSEIEQTFATATSTARSELTRNDATTDEVYAQGVADLNAAYAKLVEKLGAPGTTADAAFGAAASNATASDEATGGTSNFTLKNSATGAEVATDLATVLKVWRSGKTTSSKASASQAALDAAFAEYAAEYETPAEDDESESGDDEEDEGDESESGDEDEDDESESGDDEEDEGDESEVVVGDDDEDEDEGDETEVVAGDDDEDEDEGDETEVVAGDDEEESDEDADVSTADAEDFSNALADDEDGTGADQNVATIEDDEEDDAELASSDFAEDVDEEDELDVVDLTTAL